MMPADLIGRMSMGLVIRSTQLHPCVLEACFPVGKNRDNDQF
jgi:hypothetical protein